MIEAAIIVVLIILIWLFEGGGTTVKSSPLAAHVHLAPQRDSSALSVQSAIAVDLRSARCRGAWRVCLVTLGRAALEVSSSLRSQRSFLQSTRILGYGVGSHFREMRPDHACPIFQHAANSHSETRRFPPAKKSGPRMSQPQLTRHSGQGQGNHYATCIRGPAGQQIKGSADWGFELPQTDFRRVENAA